MNNEFERKYKGFHLGDYVDEQKLKAIVDHLELNGDTDTVKEEEDHLIVNERKVKEGTLPETYKKTIVEFKKLLSKQDIIEITAFMNLKWTSEDTRDKLYYKIEKNLKTKDETPEATYIKKDCGYVSNVLYHLFDKEDKDFLKSYREAWFDKKIVDRRKYHTRHDGEYMVLTDSEAQTKCEEYLIDDDELWKMAVEGGNTQEGIEEWAEQVINIDGYGHILSHYDGSEENITVDGTSYSIFRTN